MGVIDKIEFFKILILIYSLRINNIKGEQHDIC